MKLLVKLQRVLYFFILLCFVQLAAQAQTDKGHWTAGVSMGSLTFRSDYYNANLSPAAGYFVAPNFVVGTGVPLNFSRSGEGSNFYRFSAIGIAPFVRYYIGKAKLKPYLSFNYSYSYTRQRYNFAGALPVSDEKGHSRAISPSIGLAYFINRNVALNADLGYHWTKSTISSDYPFNGDEYTNLTIGFQIFFRK